VHDAAGAPAPDTLRVMFSSDVFLSVNRNDAIASGKVWIEMVGRKRGLDLHVEVDTYEHEEDLSGIVRQRSSDLFIMPSTHWLDLEADQAPVEARFMPQRGGYILDGYVLLARRDRRLSLPDLRGKRVLLLRTVGACLARPWMASVLRESGLGTLESHFSAAEDVDKASAAILPVFFGQTDACVVDVSSFQVMKELNPQIGNVLDVCRSSPPYLETVVCVHRDYRGPRKDLLEGLAELHRETAGKQILMTFKIDHLVPFEDRALDSVRRLRAVARSSRGVASR
jgi:phosphonate transport system substrate-binding protein